MLTKETEARYLQLRRALIEREFTKLNGVQQQAVFAVEGPLLLLAGAGTGKTTVLINRIANLLQFGNGFESIFISAFVTEEDIGFMEKALQENFPIGEEETARLLAVKPPKPWEILAITFTNKAAGEMKERLLGRIGETAADVWAYTFHKCCMRILRRDIERTGYNKDFVVYDDTDCTRLMKTIVQRLSLDPKVYEPKKLLRAISAAKDKLILPSKYAAAFGGDYRAQKVQDIYTEYQTELMRNNAFDFDDIIMQTVRLLVDNPDILEYYQAKFRYILVDEYQDTSVAQYKLVALLAGGYQNLCVVGDDDQSIYRFRGATLDNILSFENQFTNARAIRLEQNYRSTSHILKSANTVIAKNERRKDKKLWTDAGDGEKLSLYCAFDDKDEGRYIADLIFSNVKKGGTYADHAVLYRTNAQANSIEASLKFRGIPYRVVGGQRFFDRAEIKDMLSYLSVIFNPQDNMRLRRIINVPTRGIGDTSVERIAAAADERGCSMYEIIASMDETILGRAKNAVLPFMELLSSLQKAAAELPLDALYDKLLEATGYDAWLLLQAEKDGRDRLQNVKELKSSIAEFMKDNPEDATLQGFLEMITLYSTFDSVEEGADAVTMMTIHSAKGLEFNTVFLTGMEEGLFPSMQSMNEPDGMAEERRLAYVGITRARKTLHLTHAERRMLFGQTQYCMLSSFVRDIPGECIESTTPKKAAGTPAQDRYAARPRLSPLGKSSLTSGSKDTAKAFVFQMGDRVSHTVFGSGIVMQTTKVGTDCLLEIAFEKVGTKRLMEKIASKNMEKISD